MFDLLKTLYRGFGNYKKRIALLTALGFISGMLEGIGINAFIPLFYFIAGGQKGTDIISTTIEKAFEFVHIPFSFRYLLIFVCVLFVLRAISLVVSNYIKIRITTDYEEITRNDLLKKTLKANWKYLLNQRLGHLETVVMTNVQYGSLLLSNIASIFIVLTSLIAYLAVAVNISVMTTLVTIIFGGILVFLVKPLVARTRLLAIETEFVNRKISHHINENILGMKTVKTMVVGERVIDIGRQFFRSLNVFRTKSAFLKILPDSVMQSIGLIFVMTIFAVTYKMPNFNLAALAAVVYLIQRIFVYVQQLQSHLNVFGESLPYFSEVLRAQDEATANRENDEGEKYSAFKSKIKFQNVEFSYNNSRQVLNNASFVLEKGQTVGLIGPSGSGKTTIADLLLRLFKPDSGQITIDGKDINKLDLVEWRRNIGYVSQDIFLMNGTIADNIRFYDDSIGDEAIAKAAKMANIDSFIESCPDKYNTVIGERGVMLSAGQRQRIIIARVLGRNPKLLILDEATSALDNESEIQIQKVIEGLRGKLTVLVIAHRLSTIINSDKLIVLENGNIKEEGKPEDLLRDKDSYFYKVYNIRE